ncbi:MAG: hypothetical protein DDT24_00190 [Chloroflexi bacterium]|nr:hypothetical protein [Chloroflexota bacterium]
MPREMGITMHIQVHGQKGNLIGYVTIPEAVVEFDAIEDIDFVAKTDMRRVQIPVAVPYLVLRYAPLE